MSISFSGLASGLDTSSWVESLVALKQAKVTTLQKEKEALLLSKDTLNSIKSFFNSFRSTIEKITDTKLGIVSMDLFAQNLAVSANLEVLTASATTEAEEGVYNIKVDKLATNTNAISNFRTTVQKTTVAGEDSFLKDIGVTSGTIGVTVDGVKYGIAITDKDTIATFTEKLRGIGVDAFYNTFSGVFSANISAGDIDDTIDHTGIVEKLHLTGVNEGYKNNTKLEIENVTTTWDAATEGTLLSDLGVGNGTIVVKANGTDYNVTIDSSDTIGSLIADLRSHTIDVDFTEDGIFTLSDAEITDVGTTDIVNAMGLSKEIYSKSQTTNYLKYETIVTQTTAATSGTKLSEIGTGIAITNGQTVIVKNSNNEYTTITVGTSTTIGDLLEAMSNAGLYAAINNDGTIEISGGIIADGGTFDAISALGLNSEPFTATAVGNPLTETIIEYKLVDMDTRLVDDLGVTEGYLAVTDPDGNTYYQKIYSGQTIGDLMADLANNGIYSTLDTEEGILEITGGSFATLTDADVQALVANLTIAENDDRYKKGTNLLECLYGTPTIAVEQTAVAASYSRTRALTRTVTNTVDATLGTALGTLGLAANGTAIFNARGQAVTINVTKTMSIQDLMDTLEDNGIESSWDADFSRITINNATLTAGSSNLADVLNLSTTVAGKYVTSSALSSQTTITVDATIATTLKELGVTGEQTVVLQKEDSTSVTFTVDETTSVGALLGTLNANGVVAKIEDGIFSIDGGYIENTAIVEALGLVHSITGNSQILGNKLTHTIITTATGDTTLGDIINALGTADKVAGGYDMQFNSNSLTVNENTTINNLMSQIHGLGGSSSIDSAGRLHIEGGTLTGTVAEALGFSSVTTTDAVSATGETLYTITTLHADTTTKLGEIGFGAESTITIKGVDGVTLGTITTNADMTIGDLFSALASYDITGTIKDGVITLESKVGNFATGGVIDSMGIGATITTTTTVTSGVANTSTDQVSTTYTITADSSTTLSSLGYGASSTISVKGIDDVEVGTITTNGDMTIGDVLTALAGYGISGTIKDGKIYLDSDVGNYATGGVITSFGIGTNSTDTNITSGLTNVSSDVVSYTTTVNAVGSTTFGQLGYTDATTITVHGSDGSAIGTITTSADMTLDDLFLALEGYGIRGYVSDGKIYLDSSIGNYVTGGALETMGIGTTLASTTTVTVGAGHSSSQQVHYTVTADSSTTLGQLGYGTSTILVQGVDSKTVGLITTNADMTIGDLLTALAGYGISGTINDGKIYLDSDVGNYATGGVIDEMNINTSTVTITTTVGITSSSAAAITYTTTEVATGSSTLEELGINRSLTIKKDGAEIFSTMYSATTTLGEVLKDLNDNGIIATLNDGRITLHSTEGVYAEGNLISSLGLTASSTTITTTVGKAVTGTTKTYTTSILADEESLVKDFAATGDLVVKNDRGTALSTLTVSDTTTFADMIAFLSENGIAASISGGIFTATSADGNYIDGDVATELGFSVDYKNYTTGVTIAADTVTYDKEETVTILTTTTQTIYTTDTVVLTEPVIGTETIFVSDTFTVNNPVIGTNTIYVTTTVTDVSTIAVTKTVESQTTVVVTVTGAYTSSSNVLATGETKLSEVGIPGGTIDSNLDYGRDGSSDVFSGADTINDVIDWLNGEFGAGSATLEDGQIVISLDSSESVDGTLANQLGIVSTKAGVTHVCSTTMVSTAPVTFTSVGETTTIVPGQTIGITQTSYTTFESADLDKTMIELTGNHAFASEDESIYITTYENEEYEIMATNTLRYTLDVIFGSENWSYDSVEERIVLHSNSSNDYFTKVNDESLMEYAGIWMGHGLSPFHYVTEDQTITIPATETVVADENTTFGQLASSEDLWYEINGTRNTLSPTDIVGDWGSNGGNWQISVNQHGIVTLNLDYFSSGLPAPIFEFSPALAAALNLSSTNNITETLDTYSTSSSRVLYADTEIDNSTESFVTVVTTNTATITVNETTTTMTEVIHTVVTECTTTEPIEITVTSTHEIEKTSTQEVTVTVTGTGTVETTEFTITTNTVEATMTTETTLGELGVVDYAGFSIDFAKGRQNLTEPVIGPLILDFDSQNTVGDVIAALSAYGISAVLIDGGLYISPVDDSNLENPAYISDDYNDLAVKLGFEVGEGKSYETEDYKVYYNNTDKTVHKLDNVTQTMTSETTLSELGIISAEYITVVSNGTTISISTSENDTVGNLCTALAGAGISAYVDSDGCLVLQPSNGSYILDDNFLTQLGISNTATYYTTNTSTTYGNHGTSAQYTIEKTLTMTSDTTFAELGVTSDVTYELANGKTGETFFSSFSADTTVGDFFAMLGGYDIAGSIIDGKAVIDPTGDWYVYYNGIPNNLAFYQLDLLNNLTTTVVHTTKANTVSDTQDYDRVINHDTTFADLGLTADDDTIYTVVKNGVSIASKLQAENTLGDLIAQLAGYGIAAGIVEGNFFVNGSDDVYVGFSDNFKDKLFMNTQGTTTVISTTIANTTSNELEHETVNVLSTDDTFTSLGFNKDAEMTVVSDGVTYTVTVTPDMTIDDMLTTLAGYGIAGSVQDGKITLQGDKEAYIGTVDVDLHHFLKLDYNKYSTVTTQTTTANTAPANPQKYTTTNVLTTDDTLGLHGLTSEATITLVSDGTQHVVTVAASDTVDDMLTTLAGYGIVGYVDNGKITFKGDKEAYIKDISDNLETVLKLGTTNYSTTVETTTTNDTSNELKKTVTAAATGTTQLQYLRHSNGAAPAGYELELTTTSDAGNEALTLTFAATSTVHDVIDELAKHGLNAYIDSTGRFAVNSASLTDFNIEGDLGEFLMGDTFTKIYDEGRINSVSTNLIEETIVNMDDSTVLSKLNIENGNIILYQDGTKHTIAIDNTKTVGDFRNTLLEFGITSDIVDGRLRLQSDGVISFETPATGASNLVSIMGLNVEIGTGGGYSQISKYLTDTETITHSATMDDKISELTDSTGAPLGVTAGQIYVYQDGTRNVININTTDTLQDLANKLSQYGISMDISSDGKIYFNGDENSYLTTEGLTSGTASNILTKFAVSNNWSTRYDSTSETLDYEVVDNTAEVTGDTLLSDLQDADGNNLNITEGNYYVYQNGVRTTESISADTTLNDFRATMAAYGMSTDFNQEGSLQVGAYNETYLATSATGGDDTNAIAALFEQWKFTNIYTSNDLDIPTDVTVAITETTKLADINETPDIFNETVPATGTISVIKDGVKTDIELSNLDTVGDLIDELALYGFETVINGNGQLILKNTGNSRLEAVNGTKGAEILELFGLKQDDWISTNTYESGTVSVTTTTTEEISATRDTLLSDLGVTKTGEFYVWKDGVKYTSYISSDETVGSLIDKLEEFGIQTSLVDTANGSILTIEGSGNCYVQKSASTNYSDVVEKLFTTTVSENYKYEGLQETIVIETTLANATEETLLSYYNNGLLEAEGDLSVTIDGVTNTIQITADDTIGSLLSKFQALGLEATISDGNILIQSGYKDFTINSAGTTSNILATLGLTFNDDLGGYISSNDEVEQTVNENLTLSASNYAKGNTEMGLLNISSGTLTLYRDGEKLLLNIDSTQTFADIATQFVGNFSDVRIELDDKGYLTFYSITDGVSVDVGSTTDTSNFAAITGITSTGDGAVKSSRELYCVSGTSVLTTSGIFRGGDVREGTFYVGDAEFTIDSNTTLSSLISQINASKEANATAYWDSVDGKFVIKSRTTGAALVNIQAGSSNFTDVMGFTTSEWADADSDGNPDIGLSAATVTKMNVDAQEVGENARFSINGTYYTSTSNEVTSAVSRIKGVTINLKGISTEGETTLTVERDKETVANAVSDVVDSYNELIENIDKELAKEGSLKNQSTLKLIRNQIRSLMTNSVAGSGVFRNLDAIGITSDSAAAGNINTDRVDVLTFDKEKFLKAFDADRDALRDLLVGTDTNKGIFYKIEENVEQALMSGSGYFSSTEKSYNTQVSRLNDKIKKAQTAVEKYRERLEAKFASMDLLISNMQNQYSSFLGM